MDKAKKRIEERKSRANRVRRTICGTPERPRLCVRRSLKHIYAQLVDDINKKTLVQIGSLGKNNSEPDAKKCEISKAIGEKLAEKAKELGITNVVFDRKGYLFHGRIKALAEAARAKGLNF
jgi:large subunit ribosomal protein L18